MSIKTRRLDKGWSQEHLAQVSGLSTRTIQRIEAGQKPGLDSLQALAAVFETDTATLIKEYAMTNEETTPEAPQFNAAQEEAEDYVQNIKAFRVNLAVFCVALPAFFLLNLAISPTYLWVKWLGGVWLMGILMHGLVIKLMFGVFDTKWEKRLANDYQNRR